MKTALEILEEIDRQIAGANAALMQLDCARRIVADIGGSQELKEPQQEETEGAEKTVSKEPNGKRTRKPRNLNTREALLNALDHKPRSMGDIAKLSGLDKKAVANQLYRLQSLDMVQKVGEGRESGWRLIVAKPKNVITTQPPARNGFDYEAQKAALGINTKPKDGED